MKHILIKLVLIIVCLTVFSFSFKSENHSKNQTIDDGLIVYLPFNNNADDAGINHYKSVVKRARLCEDREGKLNSACHFNGSDNYIYIDSISELTSIESFSICAWIYPESYEVNSYVAWISKSVQDNLSQFRIGFGSKPDSLWGMTIYNDNTWNEYYTGNHIPLNEWSYIVFNANSVRAEAKAFLNGKEVCSWQNIKKFPVSASPLFIGYQPDDGTMFHGMIDEVRIYNRVLKPEEIVILYNL